MKKALLRIIALSLCIIMMAPCTTVFAATIGTPATSFASVAPTKIGNYIRPGADAPAGAVRLPEGIYPKGKHFSENNTPYFMMYYSNSQIFAEFDISEYADKEIKSVQVVYGTSYSEYSWSRNLRMYRLNGDWTVAEQGAVIPQFDNTVRFYEKAGFVLTAANRAKYPSNLFDSKYANGYDITQYVLDEIAAGKTKLSFSSWLDYSATCIEDVVLYVEYVNNSIPTVRFALDKTEYELNEKIVLKAVAEDKDDNISSVTFTVGLNDPQKADYKDGYYVYELDTSEFTAGMYTVTCTVTDEYGASTNVSTEIKYGKPADGNNSAPVIAVVTENELPVNSDAYITVTVNDPNSDKIQEVTAYLDENELDIIANMGDDYVIMIPGNLLSEDTHVLKIKAVDLWGAASNKEINISTTQIQRKYTISKPSKLGNYVPSTGGIYTRTRKPEHNDQYISGWSGDQLILSEYDLTDFADKQVERAELLVKPKSPVSKARHISLYEITGEWSVTNTSGSGLPAYSDKVITETDVRLTFGAKENLTDIGYPEITSDYTYSVDLTDFILTKLAAGETVADFLIICDNGRIGALDFGLYVVYRENNKPRISTEIDTDDFAANGITVETTVTSNDGIAAVTVEFDGIPLETSKNGKTYTANVAADKIFGSAHSVTVGATDTHGFTAYDKKIIYLTQTEEISPVAVGVVGQGNAVLSIDSDKVAEEDFIVEKFYIGDYAGKTISGAFVNADAYKVNGEWNVGSAKPELSLVTDVKAEIDSALAAGKKYVSLAVSAENGVQSFGLDITYTESDGYFEKVIQENPTVIYDGHYVGVSGGNVTVNAADNKMINYLNYPYALVICDGKKTLVKTSAADFSDLSKIKIRIGGVSKVEKVAFLSTPAISSTAASLKLTEYKKGVRKGESAVFDAKVIGDGVFSDALEFAILGNTSGSTVIDENGKLTIGKDEQAGYIRVVLKSKLYAGLSTHFDVRVLDAVETDFDENNVVFRVGVLSDIHLYGTYETQQPAKFRNAMKTLQAAAGGKDKLDALLVAGDITQTLSYNNDNVTPASAYTQATNFRNSVLEVLDEDTLLFYCLGNHDTSGEGGTSQTAYTNIPRYMVNVLSGSFDYNKGKYTEADEEYNSIDPTKGSTYERFFGNDKDVSEAGLYYGNRHAVYKGYHFIAIEPTNYASTTFSAETHKWLRKHLELAASDAPDQPIFVLTHEKLYDSTETSYSIPTAADINYILNDYPQVFLWTGHWHDPLNRANAIMQTGYTALEGSTTQYIDIPEKYLPLTSGNSWVANANGSQLQGHGQLLELDKYGNVRVTKVDTTKSFNEVYKKFVVSDPMYANSLAVIDEPWIISGVGADGAHLYAYDKTRKELNLLPYFDSNAGLTVSTVTGGIEVKFDAANDDDGRIIKYKIKAVKKSNGSVTEETISSMFFWYTQKEFMPKSYSWTLALPGNAEDYDFEVYPIDDWNGVGKPMTVKPNQAEAKVVSSEKNGNVYTVKFNVNNDSAQMVEKADVVVKLMNGENVVSTVTVDNLTVHAKSNEKLTVLIESETAGLTAYAVLVENKQSVPGDVNSDNKVDRKDLTRLAQYFARWSVDVNQTAADANGDDKVDRKDLTRLAQYFARWDVELGK